MGLLLLCACDQVFGLNDVEVRDGPPPPPPVCPAIGAPLHLSTTSHLVPGAHGCAQYTESRDANLSMMQCSGVIWGGPIDGTLTAIDLPALQLPFHYEAPRLAPEGKVLFVRKVNRISPPSNDFELFIFDGTTWTQTPVSLPSAGTGDLSSPTSAPNRTMMYADAIATLEELADDGTNTWSMTQTYAAGALGLLSPTTPGLSTDGLRMVITGYPPNGSITVFYSDRMVRTDRFAAAVPIDNVPGGPFPFLTDNCDRLYVDTNNDIIYVSQ